jgi:glycosyltransferase involved in cell wall biosynthesis
MIVVDVINLPSSANTLLRERVLALRRRGIDNRIVCMNGPGLDGLRALGIPVHVVDFPRGLDPVRLLVSLVRLVRYLRAERADVVHTHCSVPGAVGRVAAWLAGVPVVVHTVHGFHFHEDMPALRRAPWLLAEKALGLLTDTLLTQNRGDLALAERHGIGPRGRRGRIGNGIDLERFRRRAPRSIGNTDGAPVVTCVARFEPVKNHALLLEMTARVVRSGTPLRLRLVGTGELEGALRARAEALGIAPVVEFLGYREDIPAILEGSDVAVLTSFKEGMPRAVLEAMAMELPVVATRVPGTREAIRHGYTGFALPPDDVEGLASALGQLLRDPALRAAMGTRARQVAEAEFDERPIAESLRTLYAARLREKRPARPARAARTREPLHERLGSSSRTAR